MVTTDEHLRGILEVVAGAAASPRGAESGVLVDAEDARRAADARVQALADAVPCHVFMKDRELRWTFANASLLRAQGKVAADVLGKTDLEIFGDEAVAGPLVACDRRILETGVDAVLEERVPMAAGPRVFVSHKSPLRDVRGAVVGIIGAALDVTEAQTVERTLRDRERFLETLFGRSLDAIWLVDMSGRIVDANAAASTLLGYSADELLGKTVWDLAGSSEAMRARGRERLARAAATPGERFFATLHRKDGRKVEVDVVTQHLDVDGGRVVSFVRDVSEQRRVEEQLRQAQKLESVGRLAGGVAHDFNNQLTVILASAEAVAEDVRSGRTPSLDDVRAVLQAGAHARTLTRQLLAFARRQPVAPVAIDLSDLVRPTEKVLRRLLGEDVLLRLELAAGPCPLVGDPGQLEQIVFNLAVNARDAMPTGGELVLATSAPAPCAEAPATAPPDVAWVRLAVRDTGCGIAPEVKAHLFEPFFTTKEAGKGTGLGLATVYGIVEQMGGHVHVDSEPGRGATFTVCLPSAAAPRPAALAPALDAPAGGSETLLLVEDDALIRRVIERVLASAGYRVLTAESGPAALEVVAAEPGPIDLLLSDVVMPGMTGYELAARVVELRPAARVLHMSGYVDRDLVQDAGGPPLLTKPFTSAELLGRVRDLLDGRGRGTPPSSRRYAG